MSGINKECDKCDNYDSINPVTGLCPSCDEKLKKVVVIRNTEIVEGLFRKDMIEEMVEYGLDKIKVLAQSDDSLMTTYDIMKRLQLDANAIKINFIDSL